MQLRLSTDGSECTDALYKRLVTELDSGKHVLWFLTGGSNISIDIEVMARLTDDQTDNLTVTLTDERYGNCGHPDSNWQQLLEGGLNVRRARAFPVLQADNQSLEQTAAIYASNLDVAVQEADVVVGFYGLGSDGHIAGILPGTPAVDAEGLAVGYKTDQFTRITSTFDTIRRCDVVYMYAGGSNKLEPLNNLKQVLPISEQPAQILRELSEVYIYSDQVGDTQ